MHDFTAAFPNVQRGDVPQATTIDEQDLASSSSGEPTDRIRSVAEQE